VKHRLPPTQISRSTDIPGVGGVKRATSPQPMATPSRARRRSLPAPLPPGRGGAKHHLPSAVRPPPACPDYAVSAREVTRGVTSLSCRGSVRAVSRTTGHSRHATLFPRSAARSTPALHGLCPVARDTSPPRTTQGYTSGPHPRTLPPGAKRHEPSIAVALDPGVSRSTGGSRLLSRGPRSQGRRLDAGRALPPVERDRAGEVSSKECGPSLVLGVVR
jgi:hypothetical protein